MADSAAADAASSAGGAGDLRPAAVFCFAAIADKSVEPNWVKVSLKDVQIDHTIADIAMAAAQAHHRTDFNEANAQLFLVKRPEEIAPEAQPTRADRDVALSRPPINLNIRLVHVDTRRKHLPDWCWVVLRNKGSRDGELLS